MSDHTFDPSGIELPHGLHEIDSVTGDHSGFASHSFAEHRAFGDDIAQGAFDGPAEVHGDPTQAVPYWFAQTGEDCVPASVTQVVSEAVGHPVPEQEILQRMSELGLGQPGTDGAPFADTEKLLDSFGIPSHMEQNVSLQQLESYLDQDRDVILGVDADPIWHHQDGQSQGVAPHAVMITAIDEKAGTVTLSDTGTPDGNDEKVPLSVFMQAWGELQNQLCVTDVQVDDHGGPALMPLTLNPHPGDDPGVTGPAPVPAEPGDYTIRPGDTLWDIAERVWGNGAKYTAIAEANGIADPKLILPGQVITIPTAPQ